MLVHHLSEVPESLPVTEETRERLRAQANQLPEATVLRLCDLLAVAVEDMRQGGDPRLPFELALVKVTRPGADLSAESMAYRLELLEQRGAAPSPPPVGTDPEGSVPVEPAAPPAEPPSLELEQLRDAWQRSVLPAVERRSIPAAPVFGEARPVGLEDDTLTLEFPASNAFHRSLAEEKYSGLLVDALYEVTGRKLRLEFTMGENGEPAEEEHEPATEEDLVALVKETFDAREVE
jgi:DNA polymerase III gamma/tau subunit